MALTSKEWPNKLNKIYIQTEEGAHNAYRYTKKIYLLIGLIYRIIYYVNMIQYIE